MKNLPFKYFSCAVTFSLALLASSNAHATSQTWTGSTGSTDWNASANWGGTLPVTGDSFTFGSSNASSSTTLTDTFANGFSVSGFTFTSGALAYTMTGNSIALTGNVTNSSTALETINNAIAMTAVRTFTTTAGGGNITLGGVVSGAGGGIAVAGGGTLTLSNAANTFTGGASVSTGTLVLANGSGFASTNAFTVGAGGTLQVGNAASATNISSVDLIFSGTGSVTDGTSGKGATLTLSSVLNGTSAGAIQIASGATGTIGSGVTIALSSASHGAAITSTVPTAAGGTLDISGALTDTGTIASNGVTVNIESGGSITAGNYFMQYFQGAVLPTALNVLDGGSLTVTGTGALELNTGQGTTDTLTVGSGVGATATVTTPNLYVGLGNTGVKNGKVVLNTGGLIITGDVGDTGGTVIGTGNNFYFNGGTLRASAFPTAPASGISNFFGNIDIAYIGGNNGLNGATIDSDGHNITIAQALVTEAGVTGDTLTNTTGSVDGGVIFTDTGASAVTTLTGASTYNGGTQITGGTVLSDNAKGLGATTGSLAINSGGVLDIDNIAQTVGATTLGLANGTTGGTIQSTGGTKTLTTSGVTVNGAGNTIASSAIVIGNTTLNANSALADNGAITGTVSIGSGATLSGSGSVSSTTGVTGGTINGSGLTLTGQTSFTSGSNTLSGTETATGGVAISGTASVAQTGTLTGSVNVTSSANSTFAGVIAGAGSTLTLDNSSATVTLTGDNTYGGGTTVTAGTLAVGDASGSGTLGTGSLTLDGTLDLESNGGVGITGQTPATSSLVVGGLNGSGTITNLFLDGNAYNSSITVGAGNASGSFSGQILDGGVSSNGDTEFTSFTKEGTGTQTLSGNSAYSNGTIITGGVLSIASENNIGNTGGYFAAVGGTPGLNLGGGELQTTGTSTTITENVTLDAATTNTLAAATGTTATYTGVISDASTTAAGALTIGDSFGDNGSVTVTNFNTYTGGTTVNSGTFYVNSASGGTGTGAITVNGGQLAGSGTIHTTAGLTINGGGSLASGVAQSATSRAVDGTHLTIDSTAVTIGGLTGTANLTFALGAGTSGINGSTASSSFDYSNPNNNTTYLKLTGSTTINFAGSTSITLVDLTNTLGNNGSLAMRVGSPYLLAQAASNTSYLNLVIFNGTSYSLSQFDGTVNGIVEGVYDGSSAASSSLSSAYLAANVQGISISQLEADGATGIGAGAGGEYQGAFLVLNNGDLEVVPEPGTWALMLGGLALLIIIQRRRNQQS